MSHKKNITFDASTSPAYVTITGFESKYKHYIDDFDELQQNEQPHFSMRSMITPLGFIVLIVGTILLCFPADQLGIQKLLGASIIQYIQTNAIIICVIGIAIMGCGFLLATKSKKQLTAIEFLEQHYTLVPSNSTHKNPRVKVLKYQGDNHFMVSIK